MSTEMEQAIYAAGIPPSWGQPEGQPAATPEDERQWDERRRALDQSDRADGGFTSAMVYPPLYYLYEAVPYAVAYPGSIFDRAFAMRLANVPLLLTVVVFTWLIAGELFGRPALAADAGDRRRCRAAAAHPHDRRREPGHRPGRDLGGCAVRDDPAGRRRADRAAASRGSSALVAASCLTQPRGLALVVPAVAALALSLQRTAPPARRS